MGLVATSLDEMATCVGGSDLQLRLGFIVLVTMLAKLGYVDSVAGSSYSSAAKVKPPTSGAPLQRQYPYHTLLLAPLAHRRAHEHPTSPPTFP